MPFPIKKSCLWIKDPRLNPKNATSFNKIFTFAKNYHFSVYKTGHNSTDEDAKEQITSSTESKSTSSSIHKFPSDSVEHAYSSTDFKSDTSSTSLKPLHEFIFERIFFDDFASLAGAAFSSQSPLEDNLAF
jgi:hypothetical protein